MNCVLHASTEFDIISLSVGGDERWSSNRSERALGKDDEAEDEDESGRERTECSSIRSKGQCLSIIS